MIPVVDEPDDQRGPGPLRRAFSEQAIRLPGPIPGSPLSLNERVKLSSLEGQIRDNLQAFVAVGRSLAEIRDDRLYRETHGTFEGYVRDKWDLGRAYAYRLMDAAEVVDDLVAPLAEASRRRKPLRDFAAIPATESQARPMTKVDREERPEVWAQVLERAPRDADDQPVITAEIVEETVRQWIEPTKEKPVCATFTGPEPQRTHAPKVASEIAEEQFQEDLFVIAERVRVVAFQWPKPRQRREVLKTLRDLIEQLSPAKSF